MRYEQGHCVPVLHSSHGTCSGSSHVNLCEIDSCVSKVFKSIVPCKVSEFVRKKWSQVDHKVQWKFLSYLSLC